MTFITPYLPKEAEDYARDWMRQHRQPAFVLAFENPGPLSILVCPNCQGVGVLYIVLSESGPWKAPGNQKTVSRWYDGDGQFGKGWYYISQTLAYKCPKCKNEAGNQGD